jgi:hypothetical protein
MPSQIIQVGDEELEFPSEMQDDEIQAILSREYRTPKTSIGPTETSFESTGPADFQFEPADILGESVRQLPDFQATTRGGPRLQLPEANVAAQSALGELGGVAGDVLTHPSPIPTPFPEIAKDENPFVAAGKEVVNLAVGVPQFFTTTPGIAAAGGATVAPGLVSGLFTADLLKTLGKQIKDTYSNWSNMTGAQKAIAVTDLIGTGAFAALTAKHAGKSALDFAEQNVPRGTGISPEQPPLTPEDIYAGPQPSSESVLEPEVRARLDEETRIRQQGETPEPRPPADVGGDVVPIEEAPPPAPEVAPELPPLIPGDRLVTIRRADGTEYTAAYSDKAWDINGEQVPAISRAKDGAWSTGGLEPGEAIIEQTPPAKPPPADYTGEPGEVAVTGEELQQPKPPAGQFITVPAGNAPPVEPAPVEPVKRQPLNMAGQVRQKRAPFAGPPAFETLHPKSQERFNAAWEAKDGPAMVQLLDIANKGLRGEFAKRTGIKLPNTQGGTKATVESWAKGAFDKTAQPTPPPATPAQAAGKVQEQVKAELKSAEEHTSKAAVEAEKAVVAWATHVEDVVNPLKAKIRKIQSEVGQMAADARRTKPEVKGKQHLTKKKFLEQYGVATMDEANSLYKSKNAEWADLEKQLEEAESKRKELEATKERRSKEWSSAATRAGELRRTVFPKVREGDVGQPTPAAAPSPAVKPVEGESPIGMGGAVPSEFEQQPGTATSIKNAIVDKERAARGLPAAMQPARRTFQQVWDQTMAKIDHDPGYQDRLLTELEKKSRALTDGEDAALLHRQIDLQNEYGKATRDLAQAFEDGRTDAVAAEQARVQALSDQLLRVYEVGKKVGTETGRGLAARKMMALEDFSLAKMELDKRMAKGGRPLTPDERAEVVRLNKKIEDTQKAFDDYVAATEARDSERAIKEALGQVEAEAKKSKPGKQKPTGDVKADVTEKIRTRVAEGEQASITSLVQKLARAFIESGVRGRDALIDAVHEVLQEIIPGITRRQTMDAISGYGDFRQLTKDEISVKLRDLKGQMQQVAKLEDMQAGRPPLKTGLERRIPSPEESRLIKLVNDAKNEFQVPISDPNTQLKSSLDTLKTRMKNRRVELEGMLARKEFARKPKRTVQMDPEANRLHFEMSKAKAAWHEAMMKDRLANRSVPAKIFGYGAELLNTARAIKTSADLSAVLRQGGFIAFAHPIRAAKSFPAMFKAFRSEAGQHAVNEQIMARKNYPLYNQSGLYLSEHGQKLSQMEEAYMARWAEKIPLVAGSQRAYVTFLNKLRADSFDAMANSLARSRELTPNEAKVISNFINVATGRGNFGMKDNALVGLNTVFFAPRYVASRFQLLAGQPLWTRKGAYEGTGAARAQVAKEYARFLAGAAVVYGLAMMDGAQVENDPRSTDFGKLKYGNTRVDPMAGLLQNTVLLSKLTSGEKKTLRGKVVPLRGPKVPYAGETIPDTLMRFGRTKLSPAFGTGVNILAQKDLVGQPVTVKSELGNMLTPLAASDIYKALLDQGLDRGAALSILSIFGMGLQTYDANKSKQ